MRNVCQRLTPNGYSVHRCPKHRVQRRCVCRYNIKTRRKPLKKWVILIAVAIWPVTGQDFQNTK